MNKSIPPLINFTVACETPFGIHVEEHIARNSLGAIVSYKRNRQFTYMKTLGVDKDEAYKTVERVFKTAKFTVKEIV